MDFKVLCFMLLVAVSLTYAFTDGPTCRIELVKVNEAMKKDVEAKNKSSFRRNCDRYKQLIGECHQWMADTESDLLRNAYELACESDQVKRWLNSSASMVHPSFLISIVASLLYVLS